MRKLILVLLLFGVSASFFGCKKEGEVKPNTNQLNNPACAINVTKISASDYQFATTASGIRTYSWDFGDGTASSLSSPTHTFTQSGKYTVKLNVTKTDGTTCSSSTEVEVVRPAPTRVRISKIRVLAFPYLTPDGKTWDTGLFADPNADPYIILRVGGRQLLKTSYFDDVKQSDLPIGWNTNVTISESDFNSRVDLDLYDWDADGDDYMGGFYFTMRQWVGSYPKTVTISTTTSPYKFDMELEWL